jgi:hypothetical protein
VSDGTKSALAALERKLGQLVEQLAIDRIRIMRCEDVFVADQRAFIRLTEHLSGLEVRIIEAVDRLDAHLEEHIRKCPATAHHGENDTKKREDGDGIKIL